MSRTIYVLFVTGSRDWKDRNAIKAAIAGYPKGTWLLHGGCRGADLIADAVGRDFGYQAIRMDANWNQGKASGPLRNESMADLMDAMICAGFTIRAFVFHEDLANSKGTGDMVRRLQERSIAYDLFPAPLP